MMQDVRELLEISEATYKMLDKKLIGRPVYYVRNKETGAIFVWPTPVKLKLFVE